MEELDRSGKSEGDRGPPTFCVTGATGYIGSWLVEALLERGYRVHATVRDPAKSMHLLSLWRCTDQLRLFKADLMEEGSFDEAVKDCDGVYHVAAPMTFSVSAQENIEDYVQENIIDPAIKGTLNLLKACQKSRTVKRVVFTSSISTITARDREGIWKPVVDESCQTPLDNVWDKKASGWVYVLTKLLTEEAAFEFAKDNGMDLVSVITATVAGPFFTANVPSSVQVVLSPITGKADFFQILSAVNKRMGSIALVHIEDICRAHIFLMEHAKAEGRYICSAENCLSSSLVNHLMQQYPCLDKKRVTDKEDTKIIPSEISSKKLRDLGFSFKHDLQDIIHQTITCCLDYGYLPPLGN